jgi:hypothetical protein
MTNSSHLDRVHAGQHVGDSANAPCQFGVGKGGGKGATGPVRRGEGRLAPLLPGLVKGLEAR